MKHTIPMQKADTREKLKESATFYARRLGITYDEFICHNRSMDLVDKRHVIWHFLRGEGYLPVDMENVFGFSHSSISYGTRRIKELITIKDYKILLLIEVIDTSITNNLFI
ncbi:MAG: hypothetical protein LIP08_00075 [Bacteroides sp.]|nr:hypothetical protein [Bacteroides sp.]